MTNGAGFVLHHRKDLSCSHYVTVSVGEFKDGSFRVCEPSAKEKTNG